MENLKNEFNQLPKNTKTLILVLSALSIYLIWHFRKKMKRAYYYARRARARVIFRWKRR